MGENNVSASTSEEVITKLEKLNISWLNTEWLTEVENLKISNLKYDKLQSSVSKKDLEIDTKLSELQCPFTWSLSRTQIVPSELVSKLTKHLNEKEDFNEFEIRKFVHNIVIVFELCNDGMLEEANKNLTSILCYLEDLYRKCKEEFFVEMNIPLQHIILSFKAHLLKAYSAHLLPVYAQLYYTKMDKILSEVHPYSEMTDVEKAGMYGIKALVFAEYSDSEAVSVLEYEKQAISALEYGKQAIELNSKQAEWYFLTGKLLGRLRRCTNWNDYMKEEQIYILEHAVELYEKPSFMESLARSYIECVRSICRNTKVNEELKQKLHEMNSRAKELYMRCLELSPTCPHINICCASGMIKLPKSFVDKDMVEKCIAFALEKAPNKGMVHHVAGMFAERLKYDIEKALYHYKISSDLSVYGAMADYIRLKYTFEKDYDLLSALEKMLDSTEALPNRHNTLSCIGSYYLFLKRDLITALNYYRQIIDEDSSSSALKAHKPVFLHMKTPLNMYEILCTETHLELNKSELHKEDENILKEFVNKLNMFDSKLSEEFADKPSRIQNILNEDVMLTERYKSIILKQQAYNRKEGRTYQSKSGNNLRTSVTRGRGRGRGGNRTMSAGGSRFWWLQ